jgi:hypothetical protein
MSATPMTDYEHRKLYVYDATSQTFDRAELPQAMTREQHQYPSNYPPGTHWAIDAAWEIMDTLKPGVLSLDARSLLAGMIAGNLMRERANYQGQNLNDETKPGPGDRVRDPAQQDSQPE